MHHCNVSVYLLMALACSLFVFVNIASPPQK